ncbi:MAG: thioredoxin [Carboxydocellales bacterium]
MRFIIISIHIVTAKYYYKKNREGFLMAGENVLTFTDSNFKTDVVESAQPVLVDFWAAWCGPCRMIAPVVDEIATDYAGKVKVGKVNVDENRQVAMDFGVMSIPTLLVFKNGQPAERIVGYQNKQQLTAVLDKHL